VNFAERLAAARVLPLVTPRDLDATLRTCEALAAGGMPVVEIALRTPVALDCLSAVKRAQPGLVVAAGTVTGARDLERAVEAGADFCVSPGISAALLAASGTRGVDLLPGVATASEVMLGLSAGLSVFKLFPAVAAGGQDLLRALAGPFPAARFCPTGGLTQDNYRQFLAQPNVICCGGSWMVADSLVDGGQWERIESLARDALKNGG